LPIVQSFFDSLRFQGVGGGGLNVGIDEEDTGGALQMSSLKSPDDSVARMATSHNNERHNHSNQNVASATLDRKRHTTTRSPAPDAFDPFKRRHSLFSSERDRINNGSSSGNINSDVKTSTKSMVILQSLQDHSGGLNASINSEFSASPSLGAEGSLSGSYNPRMLPIGLREVLRNTGRIEVGESDTESDTEEGYRSEEEDFTLK